MAMMPRAATGTKETVKSRPSPTRPSSREGTRCESDESGIGPERSADDDDVEESDDFEEGTGDARTERTGHHDDHDHGQKRPDDAPHEVERSSLRQGIHVMVPRVGRHRIEGEVIMVGSTIRSVVHTGIGRTRSDPSAEDRTVSGVRWDLILRRA